MFGGDWIPAAAYAGSLRADILADIQISIGAAACARQRSFSGATPPTNWRGMPHNRWMQAFRFCWARQHAHHSRAEALDCATGTRDGVGDQIRYLRLRVAPSPPAVNPVPINKQPKVHSFGTSGAKRSPIPTKTMMLSSQFHDVCEGSMFPAIFHALVFTPARPVHNRLPIGISPARAALLFLLPVAIGFSACGGAGLNSGGGGQQSAPIASLSVTSYTFNGQMTGTTSAARKLSSSPILGMPRSRFHPLRSRVRTPLHSLSPPAQTPAQLPSPLMAPAPFTSPSTQPPLPIPPPRLPSLTTPPRRRNPSRSPALPRPGQAPTKPPTPAPLRCSRS